MAKEGQFINQKLNWIKKMDRKFLTVTIVLICVLISAIILLDFYYKNISQNNFDLGFQLGTENGISLGYEGGYVQGNASGYDQGHSQGEVLGYNIGFTQGNTTGYDEGYAQGEEAGYTQGLLDGLGSEYTIKDPTYQEVLAFISLDKTDQNAYSDNFICFDFAAEVKNNAFLQGYRCGFVFVTFPNSDHGMVCFDTLDQGLIFIEPQDDNILALIIGEPLFDRTLYEELDWDDTIVDYRIIW